MTSSNVQRFACGQFFDNVAMNIHMSSTILGVYSGKIAII